MRLRLFALFVVSLMAWGCNHPKDEGNTATSTTATTGSAAIGSSGTTGQGQSGSTTTTTQGVSGSSGSTTSGISTGSSGSTGNPCTCPQILCNGACVDPTSDPSNCGGCGITCAAPCGSAQCNEGTCVPPVVQNCFTAGASGGAGAGGGTGGTGGTGTTGARPPLHGTVASGGIGGTNATTGGTGGNTCSIDCLTTNDCASGFTCVPPDFTGTTGGPTSSTCQPCEPPNIICNGACIASDENNCGKCGNACGPFSACVAGQCECKTLADACGDGCQCQTGQTLCGTSCTDTHRDAQHCGNCNTVCQANQTCVLGICSPPGAGPATPVFAVSSFSTQGTVYGAALADVNGDGKVDLVVTQYGNSTIGSNLATYLGQTTGSFGSAILSPATGLELAILDFNGDGHPDVITVDEAASHLDLLAGDGTGHFAGSTTLPVQGYADTVRAANFSGTNPNDIFVESFDSSASTPTYDFTVYRQLDGGYPSEQEFTGAAVPTFYEGDDGVVADLDGDGITDVAATSSFYPGTSNGTFNAPIDVSPGLVTTDGDLDGDGNADLVLINQPAPSDACQLNPLRVRFGYGDGGFAAPDQYPLPLAPQFASVGRFTGGTKPDIAVVVSGYYSQQSDKVLLLRNDGTGHFTLDVQQYDLGDAGYPLKGLVSDLDGNGKDDLVIPRIYSGDVFVLRAQ
ncbi:MAG: VCBS repeat-containing protein [Deltaproteobacteria bacterium]|nr:VCBS repeat-containing protein [Deltaproteobacteria bacterium]